VEYTLCGPPRMIAACKRILDEIGVEPEDILFNDFGE
jgi:Na+-transporting NADH:ubiquinone oxidoreductase subunit F